MRKLVRATSNLEVLPAEHGAVTAASAASAVATRHLTVSALTRPTVALSLLPVPRPAVATVGSTTVGLVGVYTVRCLVTRQLAV